MKIAVEAPRKKNHIAPCTRCQSYGHTKIYCSRPYACVKCGGEHNSTLCTKDPAVPATCTLCGAEHPASYKGCIIYKNLQQARSKTHRPIHPASAQTSTSQLIILIPANFPPTSQITFRSDTRALTHSILPRCYTPSTAGHHDRTAVYFPYRFQIDVQPIDTTERHDLKHAQYCHTKTHSLMPAPLRVVLWNANGLSNHKLELQDF